MIDIPIPSSYPPIGIKHESITVIGYPFVEKLEKGVKKKRRYGEYLCDCGNKGLFNPCKIVGRCSDCNIKRGAFASSFKGIGR